MNPGYFVGQILSYHYDGLWIIYQWSGNDWVEISITVGEV